MNNKIITSVCLGLVALLAIAIVVMALVPINYAQKINNPYRICIENAKGEIKYLESNAGADTLTKQEYDKFLELYNASYQRSYLSGLLNGQLDGAKSSESKNTATSTSPITNISNYQITFVYTEEQTLTVKGEDKGQYKEVIFNVDGTTNYVSQKIYFKATTVEDNKVNYASVLTYTHQGALCTYLNEIYGVEAE